MQLDGISRLVRIVARKLGRVSGFRTTNGRERFSQSHGSPLPLSWVDVTSWVVHGNKRATQQSALTL